MCFPSLYHFILCYYRCKKPITSSLWHYRFDHVHFHAIGLTLKHFNMNISNKGNIVFCKSYCLGKSHRIHALLTFTIHINPFEVVHTDLWDPSPHLSSFDFHYYISFVDAYTKYTWIYLLKQKSEELHAFKLFLTFVKIQFYTIIKALQSDYGGEFRTFTKYMFELGISHILTCPHTSH